MKLIPQSLCYGVITGKAESSFFGNLHFDYIYKQLIYNYFLNLFQYVHEAKNQSIYQLVSSQKAIKGKFILFLCFLQLFDLSIFIWLFIWQIYVLAQNYNKTTKQEKQSINSPIVSEFEGIILANERKYLKV